jgi:hypothetical protein
MRTFTPSFVSQSASTNPVGPAPMIRTSLRVIFHSSSFYDAHLSRIECLLWGQMRKNPHCSSALYNGPRLAARIGSQAFVMSARASECRALAQGQAVRQHSRVLRFNPSTRAGPKPARTLVRRATEGRKWMDERLLPSTVVPSGRLPECTAPRQNVWTDSVRRAAAVHRSRAVTVVNVRFAALSRLKSDIAPCPRSAKTRHNQVEHV